MKQIYLVFNRIKSNKLDLFVLGIWLSLFFVLQFFLVWNIADTNEKSSNSIKLCGYIFEIEKDYADVHLSMNNYPNTMVFPEKCILSGIGKIKELEKGEVEVITFVNTNNIDTPVSTDSEIIASYDICDALNNDSNSITIFLNGDYEITLNGEVFTNVDFDNICLDNVKNEENIVIVSERFFADSVDGNRLLLYFDRELERTEKRQVETWLNAVFQSNSTLENKDNNVKANKVFAFKNLIVSMLLCVDLFFSSNLIVLGFKHRKHDYQLMRLLGASRKSLLFQKALYVSIPCIVIYSFFYLGVLLLRLCGLYALNDFCIQLNILCTLIIILVSIIRYSICESKEGI